MKQIAKGQRGIVYRMGQTAVKKPNPKTSLPFRIENEAKFLRLLNKYNIGPKFIKFRKDELSMEFIDGDLIIDYIEKSSKEQVIKVLKGVLKQCYILDKLKINKYEMTRPYKHIIVKKHKPVMIDFERCKFVDNPKNVTQFVQFMASSRITHLLKKNICLDNTKLLKLASKYKKTHSKKDFKQILAQIKNN